jgi:hypothetical protein
MLLRASRLAKYRSLWWMLQLRWSFGNKGIHGGNHFLVDGIHLGMRYHSQLALAKESHQEAPPLENPPNMYTPCLYPGARIPHLRFFDGVVMNSLVAFDGYTLLVIDDDVKVCDSYAHANNFESIEDGLRPKPVISELSNHFKSRSIPIKIVNIKHYLASIINSEESRIAKMYLSNSLVLVRPDLYVLWCLNANVRTISSFDLLNVSQIACCELNVASDTEKSKNTAFFLRNRFISSIQGYRSLHSQAIYFENSNKADVLKAMSIKNKSDVKSLTTKITNSIVTEATLELIATKNSEEDFSSSEEKNNHLQLHAEKSRTAYVGMDIASKKRFSYTTVSTHDEVVENSVHP